MAFPKPIRVVLAATMILFIFLVLQIMRHPGDVKVPGLTGNKMEDMVRDPNLDGKRDTGLC